MKKILICVFALTLVFAIKAETIKITAGEWAPYISKSLENDGPVSQVVTEAFKEVGIDVEYGFFPWKRAFSNAEKGSWDGTIVWNKTAEREKTMLFSEEPVFFDKTVLFHLKSTDLKWDGTKESLKPFKIGVTDGYNWGEILTKGYKDKSLQVEKTTSDLLNFKKLLKGRTDVFMCSFFVGYDIVSNNFSKADQLKFTNHPKPLFEPKGLYFLVGKANPKAKYWLGKFNEGLKKLKEKGRVKEIMGE